MSEAKLNEFLKPKLNDVNFIMQCSNPIFFINKVLGYPLSAFHKEFLNIIRTNRYNAIEVPVGHGKTTLISKGYALWKLWKEPNVELCLTSSSLEQSMKILDETQKTIEGNVFLQELMPKNTSLAWNKKKLSTSKNGQYYVRPFNDSARGIHPDVLIYDDILRMESSDVSADQINEMFWSVFFPRGQTKRCQHILVGTPRSAGDLFDDIEEKAKRVGLWKHVHKACVSINADGSWNKPLWPERFTLDELREIRDNMSATRFSREYMCNPVVLNSGLYSQEKLGQCFDHYLDYSYKESEGYTVMGLDVAFSRSNQADYTVPTIVTQLSKDYVVKQDLGERVSERVVSDGLIIKRMTRTHSVNYDELESLCRMYGVHKVIVDKSTGGVLVCDELRSRGINVEEQIFDPMRRKILLLNLWKIIDQGRLIIPYKDGTSAQVLSKILSYELRGIQYGKTRQGNETFISTTKHDDTVMSVALAVKDFTKKSHSNILPIYSIKKTQPVGNDMKELYGENNCLVNTVIEAKTIPLPGL